MFTRESSARSSTNSGISGPPRACWTLTLAVGMGLGGCTVEADDPDTSVGGSVSSAGSLGTAGTSVASAGTGTSGATSTTTAGTAAQTGGTTAGGSATTGGSTTTAGTSSGGLSGSGGSGGRSSGGAAGSGGSGSGACEKGTTKGKEVLFIGESFVAASSIPEETTKLAIAAGSLAAGDAYIDKSVSGTWIGNGASNSIPNQYKTNSNGVRFVLMNGGGNDCWQGGMESHRTAALDAAKKLFQDMGTNGVKKVVYFFYPDPIGSQYANLTSCLNLLRPAMKTLCDAQTSPTCYWVDLRETWNGHADYTSDGIHVAAPGNVPTAKAIFDSMTKNCVAP